MKLFLKDLKLLDKEEERKLHLDDFYILFLKSNLFIENFFLKKMVNFRNRK